MSEDDLTNLVNFPYTLKKEVYFAGNLFVYGAFSKKQLIVWDT